MLLRLPVWRQLLMAFGALPADRATMHAALKEGDDDRAMQLIEQGAELHKPLGEKEQGALHTAPRVTDLATHATGARGAPWPGRAAVLPSVSTLPPPFPQARPSS